MRKPCDMPLVVPDEPVSEEWFATGGTITYLPSVAVGDPGSEARIPKRIWCGGKVIWESDKCEPVVNINVMPGSTRETAYQVARSAFVRASTRPSLDAMSEADQRALWHELNLKFAVR